MPEAYRLNMGTMAVIMENYANQLAEQYGQEVAADILKRSQLNLNAGAAGAGSNPYRNAGQTHAPMSPFHAKYDSLSH
ncbi:hypothetical protein BJ912DRAFT_1060498 [Pholiota molesta]|nr:hypothetical protein BJ912DRAFT_1060498 [Pholiota molesta]